MAPKRKAAAASEAKEEVKKAKSGLAVGDDLPEIGSLETEEPDKTVDLKELSKEKGIIIFFYPKANTAGCTTQACGFRDSYEAAKAAGYEIFGMSADKAKAQAGWKAKNKFPYHLLCDPSFEAMKKLGVTKGPKSINRSHIIIEKGGKVAAVEYGITPKDSIAKATEYVAAMSKKPEVAEKAAEVEKEVDAEKAEEAEKPINVTLTVDQDAQSVSLVINSVA